jgi:hypothetical protein
MTFEAILVKALNARATKHLAVKGVAKTELMQFCNACTTSITIDEHIEADKQLITGKLIQLIFQTIINDK